MQGQIINGFELKRTLDQGNYPKEMKSKHV